jgi:SWI/SNF-related matrix-associated actin-dependent regulator of chromatin subfamily A member 5
MDSSNTCRLLVQQDRAHRIGQKKPVQVFRLVSEHTIEEKIVERAQQKLKLDAMVVQQGRLRGTDNKLSRDELMAAVRFGADKIFKSKDSTITDDDIDLIMDAGKKRTQELNDKLQAAEKGDLLDFKLDGSNVQTFEGIDYSSSALVNARADASLLGIFDIGKRERKEANYNENSLFQQQISGVAGGASRPKKPKIIKLPKHLRLPRMEEWQMYDRETLKKIQEEEETAFRSLPEEQQKLATNQSKATGEESKATPDESHAKTDESKTTLDEDMTTDQSETVPTEAEHTPFELPPLISEEKAALKEKLLAEGFSEWKRNDFQMFLKASARLGRNDYEKIALEVAKPESDVREFAAAFWGELGKARMSEHEYDRAVKSIEKGEKKIGEVKRLELANRKFVMLFDNPWEELEFTFVQTKDKLFTDVEDRHLVCWCYKVSEIRYAFGF